MKLILLFLSLFLIFNFIFGGSSFDYRGFLPFLFHFISRFFICTTVLTLALVIYHLDRNTIVVNIFILDFIKNFIRECSEMSLFCRVYLSLVAIAPILYVLVKIIKYRKLIISYMNLNSIYKGLQFIKIFLKETWNKLKKFINRVERDFKPTRILEKKREDLKREGDFKSEFFKRIECVLLGNHLSENKFLNFIIQLNIVMFLIFTILLLSFVIYLFLKIAMYILSLKAIKTFFHNWWLFIREETNKDGHDQDGLSLTREHCKYYLKRPYWKVILIHHFDYWCLVVLYYVVIVLFVLFLILLVYSAIDIIREEVPVVDRIFKFIFYWGYIILNFLFTLLFWSHIFMCIVMILVFLYFLIFLIMYLIIVPFILKCNIIFDLLQEKFLFGDKEEGLQLLKGAILLFFSAFRWEWYVEDMYQWRSKLSLLLSKDYFSKIPLLWRKIKKGLLFISKGISFFVLLLNFIVFISRFLLVIYFISKGLIGFMILLIQNVNNATENRIILSILLLSIVLWMLFLFLCLITYILLFITKVLNYVLNLFFRFSSYLLPFCLNILYFSGVLFGLGICISLLILSGYVFHSLYKLGFSIENKLFGSNYLCIILCLSILIPVELMVLTTSFLVLKKYIFMYIKNIWTLKSRWNKNNLSLVSFNIYFPRFIDIENVFSIYKPDKIFKRSKISTIRKGVSCSNIVSGILLIIGIVSYAYFW